MKRPKEDHVATMAYRGAVIISVLVAVSILAVRDKMAPEGVASMIANVLMFAKGDWRPENGTVGSGRLVGAMVPLAMVGLLGLTVVSLRI